MPTKLPARSHLPKYLAQIDLNDPDSYREPIRGMFYETFDILSDEMGPFDVPSVDEVVRYHPTFQWAQRTLGVRIERHWVRDKKNPFARPQLAYHFCNIWSEGHGGREDYILISESELPRFTRRVRYVLRELAAARKARAHRRKPTPERHKRLRAS